MGFLDGLGSALLSSVNQQFGVAENTPGSLDTVDQFGKLQNFGALGDFAKKIDASAQRQYIETGMIRNVRPRNLEIFMQEPDITVLVKKRQFSSLSENYRYDLMNDDDKLFIRAVKRLFYNKCRIIAAYERLTKMEKVATNSGIVNDFFLTSVFSSVDAINELKPGLIDSQTQSVFDTIRRVKNFSDPNFETTWIVDKSIPYASPIGEGTGVFELTNVASIECTNSVSLGAGGASLTIEDPYGLMIINNEEIDQAISDAANFFSQNNFFKLTQTDLEDTITSLKERLDSVRIARGATRIKFLVNDNSLLFQKVRAIFDETGIEIKFTFNGGLVGIGSTVDLDASAQDGPNGIITANGEDNLFKQIIQNTYVLIGLQQTTASQIKKFNQQTNYVRRKMRLQYGGKNMIQPMDVVHIFISSKTVLDDKIVQGLNLSFSANSIVNKINQTVGEIDSSFDNLEATFNGTGGSNSYLEAEKNIIAGPDFPTWLWSLMRNDFTRQAAGTHVFAGIVDDARHNYDGGKHTLNVSCSDNSKYFQFGQININPSVDVFNSDLYDPLTPFKLNFDSSSGFIRGEFPDLLDENIRLLNSGSIKAKLGRFRGLPVNQANYTIQNAEPLASTAARRKLYDPDGFVYRWKEGIGSLTLFGEPHASGTFKQERSPALTNDPFAGQDVMNVLSLLITGQPYNFNNFLRAAIQSGNMNSDDLTNESSSTSYFRGLVSDLTKQNQTWGNFLPFKKLIINESGYAFLSSGEFDMSATNKRVSQLLKDRAERFDQLTSLLPQFANNPQFYKIGAGGSPIVDASTAGLIDVSSLSKLGTDIIELDTQIQQQQNDFQQHLQQANINQSDGSLTIYGNDISFDPTVTFSTNATTQDQIVKQRDQFRKKINYLTQRRLWKVKANEDQNLFIVDDSYDKNYDIQGFEQSLAGSLQTFKSTYTTVFERIKGVSEILGLEVFADSQGHIQCRPPQYNRTPSSVFYDMIQQRDRKGIQIFPDFLESLFLNQIEGLTDQLEITEDEIRIRCAALGATDDVSAKQLLNGSSLGGNGRAFGSLEFVFVTDQSGNLGGKDLRALIIQANPDLQNASSQLNNLATNIRGATNATINFDVVQRINVVNSSQTFTGVQNNINDAIIKIGTRLAQKKNEPAPTLQTLLSNDRTLAGAGRSQLDILNLTEQISQFISERQYQVKLLSNAIKNLNQGIVLNNDPDPAKNFLFPFLNNKPTDSFPEMLEHMIEDEDFDDLGYHSGKRYVLTDSRIISSSYSEKAPDWTIVEVDGQLAQGLVQGPASLGGITNEGGNAISSAFAVDYDMWRMYGFRAPHAVNVPFLSDPEGQCAPYAVYLLNRARKDIFQATVTTIGNEFIQAGEVYYIENRDMLYYAESVTHSFSYGGQYSTNLKLRYGHNPGEYIPTMLDIIGKGLYSNRGQANLIKHSRQGNATGDTAIVSLVYDNKTSGTTNDSSDTGTPGVADLVGGSYGNQNRKNLGNLMLATTGLLTPAAFGQDLRLEIRIYYNSKKGSSSADSNLQSVASSIQDWIFNPAKATTNLDGQVLVPDNNNQSLIDKSKITLVPIDLGDVSETRSPSSQAWDLARTVAVNSGTPITDSEGNINNSALALLETNALFLNVIDIWATFTPITQGSSQNVSGSISSQADLTQQNKYIANFQSYLSSLNNKSSG